MKKFKFKLQTLLNIRESREKEIQNELAKILSLQNRERATQDELREKIEAQKNIFSDRVKTGSFSVKEAQLFERFVDVALRAIDTASVKIEEMEPEVQEVRGASY